MAACYGRMALGFDLIIPILRQEKPLQSLVPHKVSMDKFLKKKKKQCAWRHSYTKINIKIVTLILNNVICIIIIM